MQAAYDNFVNLFIFPRPKPQYRKDSFDRDDTQLLFLGDIPFLFMKCFDDYGNLEKDYLIYFHGNAEDLF
jgi:hypothetical protein